MGIQSNEIVSVVVVTKGVGGYLWNCLDSLKEQTYPHRELIIIDNSLNPDFNREIPKRFSFAIHLVSPQNLYYCEALNKGIALSKGDFVLCLNDDVVLERDFIALALKGFFHDEKIGLVSGKILRNDKKTIDSAGLFLSIFRTAKERGYGVKDEGRFENEEYIFAVNGAVAFYRRKMLKDVKEGEHYFDPNFHIFYEDLDIAWRAQRLGWKGYYVPQAVAYHVRGATVRSPAGINRPFARRFLDKELHLDLIKNRHLAIIKNESVTSLCLRLPLLLLYDFCALAYCVVYRPWIIKELFMKARLLKEAFQKRKMIFEKFKKMSAINL